MRSGAQQRAAARSGAHLQVGQALHRNVSVAARRDGKRSERRQRRQALVAGQIGQAQAAQLQGAGAEACGIWVVLKAARRASKGCRGARSAILGPETRPGRSI